MPKHICSQSSWEGATRSLGPKVDPSMLGNYRVGGKSRQKSDCFLTITIDSSSMQTQTGTETVGRDRNNFGEGVFLLRKPGD